MRCGEIFDGGCIQAMYYLVHASSLPAYEGMRDGYIRQSKNFGYGIALSTHGRYLGKFAGT